MLFSLPRTMSTVSNICQTIRHYCWEQQTISMCSWTVYLCFVSFFFLSALSLSSSWYRYSKIGRRNQSLGRRLSISSLTRKSCSTQLSCQHPNITVNRPACAFDITIGSFFYNFSLYVALFSFYLWSVLTFCLLITAILRAAGWF